MLAARCPQCGAASPVSVATPELLDCSYCPYVGRPPEAVVQELYAAQHALHAMDRGRRQLSAGQLRAVSRARTSTSTLKWLLGLVLIPLLLCGGSCGALVLATEVTPFSVLFLLAALGPAGLVLVSGYLLIRSHRRAVAQLALTCAAVPSAAAGRPAMCHVCGAPLVGSVQHGLTRCGYCHADNILDAEIMRAAAAQEGAVTSAMAHAVAQHATVISSQSGKKMQLTLILAIASPFVGAVAAVVLMVTLAAASIPVDPNEQYALVQVAGTRCLAVLDEGRLRSSHNFPHGIDFGGRPVGSLPRVKASELIGREVLTERNQVVKIAGLSRNLLNAHNWVEIPGRKTVSPGSLCEKPPDLVQLAHDQRLASCLAIYPRGDKLFVLLNRTMYSVPRSGGALTQVAELQGTGTLLQAGNRIARISDGNLEVMDLDATPIQSTPHAMGVKLITFAGERIVYATPSALFLESESHAAYSQLAPLSRPPSSIAATATNVYWVNGSGLLTLQLSGGTPKQLDEREYLTEVFVVGPQLMARGTTCSLMPISGGPRQSCPYPQGDFQGYRGSPFTDATHGYLIPKQGGLQSFSLSEPSKFQRLYGPASKSVSCAAVDDDYAYWVDGPYLQRDKKQQP